ncbi:helix-turn-helix domain-containing protein [Alkalimarinus coralli]|uniref:helix-turn-helix domain-containing protein n=1 Tax=Alkalimarinus coralli TaxID=2935863 RepID=UPI00202B546E|nr:helix-turn-helix domain-containing protein [Alkalimarinus coralli]
MKYIHLPTSENSRHINCSDCALSPICEPTPIGSVEFDVKETLLMKKQPFKTGELIYKEGQPFEFLYAITSGSAKEVCLYGQPQEQVISFKLKGELAGQNAVATDIYPNSLVALEDCDICVLPYKDVLESATSLPQLLTKIVTLFSIDSYHESEVRKSLASATTAESKVAAFLYNISLRHKNRNQNYIDIKLSMSRSDIANYLGITKETLSRSLTRIQNRDLIETSGKYIHISNFEHLKEAQGLSI